MEPKYVENSVLSKWLLLKFKLGLIPYVLIVVATIVHLPTGIVAAIMWVGIRTEFMLATLRYGDTVNSRRLEMLEDKMGLEIDYEAIHASSGGSGH